MLCCIKKQIMRIETKNTIDKGIGILILLIIGIIVGRYYLSDVEEYKKLETKVSNILKIPQITTRISGILGIAEDENKIEVWQRQRKTRIEKERRPTFDIQYPLGRKGVEIEYKVTPLLDKAYYPAIRKTLRRARSSIYVSMFVIKMGDSFTDPVNILLNDLIAAQKRGVNVKVVAQLPASNNDPLYQTNEEAIEYLVSGNVNARFNHPWISNHDKFVLIDESILILGNHNWSRQALTVNKEASVMIEAFPTDPEYVRHFCAIELAKPEETEKARLAMIKELQKNLLKRTKLKK